MHKKLENLFKESFINFLWTLFEPDRHNISQTKGGKIYVYNENKELIMTINSNMGGNIIFIRNDDSEYSFNILDIDYKLVRTIMNFITTE